MADLIASSASIEQCTSHCQSLPRIQCVDSKGTRLTLYGWQTQFFRDFGVLDPASLLESHATYELSQIAGAGDGTAATESLELDIADGVAILIDTDLKLHDISAGGSAYESSSDVDICLGHRADIARIAVVVEQCQVSQYRDI